MLLYFLIFNIITHSSDDRQVFDWLLRQFYSSWVHTLLSHVDWCFSNVAWRQLSVWIFLCFWAYIVTWWRPSHALTTGFSQYILQLSVLNWLPTAKPTHTTQSTFICLGSHWIKNTTSNNSSIVVCIHCLVMALVLCVMQPLPSNGSFPGPLL